MAKVFVGLPNLGSMKTPAVFRLFSLLTEEGDHFLRFDQENLQPVECCRNAMIKRFIEKTRAEFVLFIDADNPPVKSPLDLIAGDYDVMIFPTLIAGEQKMPESPGQQLTLQWNIWGEYDEETGCWEKWRGGHEGLTEIGAGGSGCMLIARRVLQKVRPAFQLLMNEDGLKKCDGDLLFCKLAKEAGFKVWAHWDYYCHHYKQVELTSVLNALHVASGKALEGAQIWR